MRAAGTELHVTLRLEDGATGAALWADRLVTPKHGTTGLPEAALLALSAHLNRQIARHSLSAARRKPLEALSARELCLIGRDHHGRVTQEDTALAKDMFARAIAVDPDYGQAYAWQAYTVQRAITHGWGSPSGEAARDESLRLARRAVQLQPESTLCLARLAFALVLDQRWEEAVDAAHAALTSSRPAFGYTRITCCEVLTAAGHPEEAARIARETIALEPLYPPTAQGILGRALLLAGKVEEALPPLRWCASRLPDYAATFDTLVVALVESGRSPEALTAWKELLRLKPGWEPRNHTGFWYFRRPEDLSRFQAAHRRVAELAGGTDGQRATIVTPPLRPEPSTLPVTAADTQTLADLRRDTLVVDLLRAAPDDQTAADAASALSSDLVAELVRYENLRIVAARGNGLRQGLGIKGDVHSAGARVFAVIRLEDLAAGTVVWAKRLEWRSNRAVEELAESARALAAAIDVQIGRESLGRARRKPAERLTAREFSFIGKDLFQRGTKADTKAARDMFARASVTDPEYAPAHAWHVLTLTRTVIHGWDGPDQTEVIARAVGMARNAVELEPESPLSRAALALALGLQGRWDEAVSTARLALHSDRATGEGTRISCGEVLAAAGHPEEAEEVLRETIARNPHGSPAAHAVLGRALLLCGRPEEAVSELRLCAAHLPDYALCFRTMVVAATEAGLLEDAHTALHEIGRLRPAWVQGTEPIFWFLRRKEDAERWQKAFEMASRLDAAGKMGGLVKACISRA